MKELTIPADELEFPDLGPGPDKAGRWLALLDFEANIGGYLPPAFTLSSCGATLTAVPKHHHREDDDDDDVDEGWRYTDASVKVQLGWSTFVREVRFDGTGARGTGEDTIDRDITADYQREQPHLICAMTALEKLLMARVYGGSAPWANYGSFTAGECVQGAKDALLDLALMCSPEFRALGPEGLVAARTLAPTWTESLAALAHSVRLALS